MDAMLESGSVGQLDEWIAFEQLEPSGDDWRRSSMVATQIINAIMQVAAGYGGEKFDEKNLLPVDAFVPHQMEPKEDKLTLAQGLAQLRMMTGV